MIRSGLVLVFLLGFLTSPASVQAKADNLALFRQEIGRQVEATLHRRRGLVLWLDREDGRRWIFGDAKLLDQPFLPGSWLKLLLAEAAARRGIDQKYHCSGQDKIGGKIRHCWTYKGHGDLDLAKALGVSCNLYFEKLGLSLGYSALRQASTEAGFAAASALSEDGKEVDLALLAIGDEPRFAVTPEEAWKYWLSLTKRLDRPELGVLRQGMRRAVSQGTARQVAGSPLLILAKTGTGDSLGENYPTNGWFLGAYPMERPRWLLLIFLQEAHGFAEAASLADRIYRWARHFEVLP